MPSVAAIDRKIRKEKSGADQQHAARETLKSLVAPFRWEITNDDLPPQATAWLNEPNGEAAPSTLLRLVEIPPDRYLPAFRNLNDARALAYVVLDTLAEYRTVAERPKSAAGTVKIRCKNGAATPFGTVYTDDQIGFRVWFGRKAGQLPALEGAPGIAAIQKLFGDDVPLLESSDHAPRDQREASPVAEPSPASKPKRVAKPKAAEPRTPRRTESATLRITDLLPAKSNHRKTFDKTELQQLAESIRQHGILQPLLVRPIQASDKSPSLNYPESHVIIAGERRYRAAKLAGLQEVPVQIVDLHGLDESLAMFEENVRREDLSPIERARAIRSMMDEHGLTQAQIAKRIGVTQGQISNELRLLQLPENLQALVSAGRIAPTLIRSALPYCDLPPVMAELSAQIVARVSDAGTSTAGEGSSRVGDTGHIEVSELEDWIRSAILKHSRPMAVSASPDYAKPDPKLRYFSKVSADDLKDLAPRTFDCLNLWDGRERTFNVAKFDELNAKPLAARKAKHAKWKQQHNRDTGPTGHKTGYAAGLIESELTVHREVQRSIACCLAEAIEAQYTLACKDRAAVSAVLQALAIVSGESMCESVDAKPVFGEPVNFRPLLELLANPKARDARFREILVEHLRSDWSQPVRELLQLGEYLGTDLRQIWRADDAFLKQALTEAGRAKCAELLGTEDLTSWPAGWIPEFLESFFEIKPATPAKPAKKKKGAA